jgi:hypothetical protein
LDTINLIKPIKTKIPKPFRNILALAAVILSLVSLPFANAAITSVATASTAGTSLASLPTEPASSWCIKPVRNTSGDAWNALVDLGTQGLTGGIRNNTGAIVVFRKGKQYEYGDAAAIPDGQKTVLSCIFQEDGTFMIYANGVQIVNNITTTDPNMPLNPIIPWYGGSPQSTNWASHINVGRTNGAGWASENGLIGDVFVYTSALSDVDRLQLEADLTAKFFPAVTDPYVAWIDANYPTLPDKTRGGDPDSDGLTNLQVKIRNIRMIFDI